jgi:hypothetical protein
VQLGVERGAVGLGPPSIRASMTADASGAETRERALWSIVKRAP